MKLPSKLHCLMAIKEWRKIWCTERGSVHLVGKALVCGVAEGGDGDNFYKVHVGVSQVKAGKDLRDDRLPRRARTCSLDASYCVCYVYMYNVRCGHGFGR